MLSVGGPVLPCVADSFHELFSIVSRCSSGVKSTFLKNVFPQDYVIILYMQVDSLSKALSFSQDENLRLKSEMAKVRERLWLQCHSLYVGVS